MDKKALQGIITSLGIDSFEIAPFKSVEDGAEYNVWKVGSEFVLKKAKGCEIQI